MKAIPVDNGSGGGGSGGDGGGSGGNGGGSLADLLDLVAESVEEAAAGQTTPPLAPLTTISAMTPPDQSIGAAGLSETESMIAGAVVAAVVAVVIVVVAVLCRSRLTRWLGACASRKRVAAIVPLSPTGEVENKHRLRGHASSKETRSAARHHSAHERRVGRHAHTRSSEGLRRAREARRTATDQMTVMYNVAKSVRRLKGSDAGQTVQVDIDAAVRVRRRSSELLRDAEQQRKRQQHKREDAGLHRVVRTAFGSGRRLDMDDSEEGTHHAIAASSSSRSVPDLIAMGVSGPDLLQAAHATHNIGPPSRHRGNSSTIRVTALDESTGSDSGGDDDSQVTGAVVVHGDDDAACGSSTARGAPSRWTSGRAARLRRKKVIRLGDKNKKKQNNVRVRVRKLRGHLSLVSRDGAPGHEGEEELSLIHI